MLERNPLDFKMCFFFSSRKAKGIEGGLVVAGHAHAWMHAAMRSRVWVCGCACAPTWEYKCVHALCVCPFWTKLFSSFNGEHNVADRGWLSAGIISELDV